MTTDLAHETYGLADCLRLLDWTPERLAREVNRTCGAGTISAKAPYHWLKGSKPRGKLRHTVADILSVHLCRTITAQQLWPSQQSPAQSTPPWLPILTDQQIMDEAVSWLLTEQSAVDEQEASPRTEVGTMVRHRVDQLHSLGNNVGGKIKLQGALHDLNWASSLLADPDLGATVQREVAGCVADLGRLASWLLLDHGRLTWSKACLCMALRAAVRVGDRSVAAYLVSCLAYVYLWQGMHKQALQLMRIAQRGVSGLRPEPTHAVLDSRRARVHALRGEVLEAQRCIDQAFTRLADCEDGSGEAAAWISPAVILGDAGRSWLDAGLPADAERDLAAVLRQPSLTCRDDRLLHLTSLSQARFDQGEFEGTNCVLKQALRLQQEVRSSRVELRLRQLHRRFAANSGATAQNLVTRLDEHFMHAPPLSIN